MVTLPNILTSWTQTGFGKVAVPVAILGLGLSHWGRYAGWMDTQIPLVDKIPLVGNLFGTVGNVAGVMGIIVGTSMMLNEF
jgi:hypothetical protein|tara:strand:- start:417 stop:659 length:243 start_codon:yes stop_codon:yes gene_type:complete